MIINVRLLINRDFIHLSNLAVMSGDVVLFLVSYLTFVSTTS